MPITPYTGPFGRPELQHLLRRSLFGCTVADRAHFEGMSLAAVVDELLTFTNDSARPVKTYTDANGDPDGIDQAVPFGQTWVNTPITPLNDTDVIEVRLRSWAGWWMGQLVDQQRNLREKLTRIDITRYGHAMSVPVPGRLSFSHLWNQNGTIPASKGHHLLSINDQLTPTDGRLRFAHSDWSGYSVFEEAFTRGHMAASAP